MNKSLSKFVRVAATAAVLGLGAGTVAELSRQDR